VLGNVCMLERRHTDARRWPQVGLCIHSSSQVSLRCRLWPCAATGGSTRTAALELPPHRRSHGLQPRKQTAAPRSHGGRRPPQGKPSGSCSSGIAYCQCWCLPRKKVPPGERPGLPSPRGCIITRSIGPAGACGSCGSLLRRHRVKRVGAWEIRKQWTRGHGILRVKQQARRLVDGA